MCGLSGLLAPSHWLVMEVQQKLLGLYTRPASPLSRPQLERKVQLGGLVLRYMDLVDPANPASPARLHLLSSQADTALTILTAEYRAGGLSKADLTRALQQKQRIMKLLSCQGK